MKAVAIVKYLFLVIGVGMLIGSFFLYKSTQEFLVGARSAEGEVIDLVRSRSNDSTTYKPVVKFKTQEGMWIEITSSAGSNPPSYTRGETVEVLYHESFPEKGKINSFFSLWGALTIFAGLGAVFFLFGFIFVMSDYRKTQKINQLKLNGSRIKTRFQSAEQNSRVKMNGRSPFQIHTQWKNPLTSEIHVFSSEHIWFDPTEYINTDEITVLIDRDNPKKYYVDISFLPRQSD